ncbi:MAG: 50S ribosomal protein L4 [Patescibacteria group bacterium]|jgi:large subunit ribosomal protein L4|nr:50S ribosomal protein L4 [Patescibacteria group bacterium]MDD3778308.1 50S ribosomal protein L4 [Patescibacteria group bacterium]MDD3939318.1 50S ribosomal protein L4 [Patescibacteria group bacterium]MDD4443956.1 50S ribosomal protein L4 [Patescibacteria group bacterium]NCU39512.1 50S ribosomal protein L4 [Candidatus Falkowbacteria bacterium]
MSLKIKIHNQVAEEVKDLSLAEAIFAVPVKTELIHQAVVAQNNNARQVLAHTKDRSEVSGGGKKPWKQKGTGRARVGSSRSPIWIGGGVTFGPRKDRNFKQKINQKMKQKAIFMALSDRLQSNSLVVIDNLKIDDYKTKKVNEIFSTLESKILKTDRRSLLVINENKDEKLKYSARNLEDVKVINIDNINLVDILNHRYLLITEKAVAAFTKRYNK